MWTHLKFEQNKFKKDKMIFVEMICLISNKSLLKRIEVWMEGLKLDIWMLKNSWIQENTFIFCLVLKRNCNLSKLRYVVIASVNKVVVPCYSNIVEWKSIWIELIIIGEI